MSARPRYLLTCLGAAALLYVLYFHGLGERELWSSHEARAAQNAQGLLEGCDWRLPRLFDGRPELQKPPMYYWLVALAGWWRDGVDAIAVRLPAALGALASALAIWVWLRGAGQPRAANLAALILLTMIHFTWMGRVGRIDMPLTAAVAWCLVAAFMAVRMNRTYARFLWLLAAYLSLAAGLFLKGPIAAVLVGAGLAAIGLAGAWRRLYSKGGQGPNLEADSSAYRTAAFSLLWGIPLVASLALPWCWWVNQATDGGFVSEFLIRHNFQRGLGGDEQLDAHVSSWWFYMARLVVDWLPWSLLLPAAFWTLWRDRDLHSAARTGICWALGMLLCLSFMQYKRADYLLPAYPGAAVFLGLALERWAGGLSERGRRLSLGLGTGAVVCLAAGWFAFVEWGLPAREPERALGPFAHVVRCYLPRPGQVILFRVDSHHLNWELGKKTERIWEWENLSWWATRPEPIYMVMPKKFALEWTVQLGEGKLIELARSDEFCDGGHDCPLVLFVNEPGAGRAALVRRQLLAGR